MHGEINMRNEESIYPETGAHPVFKGGRIEGNIYEWFYSGKVIHNYVNPYDVDIEAIGTMYVPKRAVVTGLSCRLNDADPIVAKVVKEEEAKRSYERSVGWGDTAGILEHDGDLRDVFTFSAGNLRKNETMSANLDMLLELEQAEDKIRLVIPTAEIPKYGDPSDAGRKDHQVPGSSHFIENQLEVSIRIHGDMEPSDISCPNHKVKIVKKDGHLLVTSVGSLMDCDFILLISRVACRNRALVAREKKWHYALARLYVPEGKQENECASVKLLVDCSASMEGKDIMHAREFVHEFLARLTDNDLCTISRFGSHCENLTVEPIRTNPDGKRQLRGVPGRIQADMGGTALAAAVGEIANLGRKAGLRDILIVTDGAISGVHHVISAARSHRCFIVGVGCASHSALEMICQETGGKYFSIDDHEGDYDKVARLVHLSMRQAKATKIKAKWPNAPTWEVVPTDIWGQQSVDCIACFDKQPQGTVSLSYSQGGKKHRHEIDLVDAMDHQDICNLAKGRRIGDLYSSGEHEKAISLAEKWQLLGRGTSLVFKHVRKSTDKATGDPTQVKPPQMVPQGSFGQSTESETFLAMRGYTDTIKFCQRSDQESYRRSYRRSERRSERRSNRKSGHMPSHVEASEPRYDRYSAVRKLESRARERTNALGLPIHVGQSRQSGAPIIGRYWEDSMIIEVPCKFTLVSPSGKVLGCEKSIPILFARMLYEQVSKMERDEVDRHLAKLSRQLKSMFSLVHKGEDEMANIAFDPRRFTLHIGHGWWIRQMKTPIKQMLDLLSEFGYLGCYIVVRVKTDGDREIDEVIRIT